MKKQTFYFALFLYSFLAVSCQKESEPTPSETNVFDERNARIDASNSFYLRFKIQNPIRLDFDSDQRIYWVDANTLPSNLGFSLQKDNVLTAAQMSQLKAKYFTVKRGNTRKLLTKSFNMNTRLVLIYYNQFNKGGWIIDNPLDFSTNNLFQATETAFYSNNIYSFDWNNRPQGF